MLVVFSPHLDDAVLSMGGQLLEARRHGRPCVVVTLFSAGEGSLYRRRRREDQRALASVGVEAVHLGLPDAPFRLGRAFSFASLLLGPPPSPPDIAAAIAAVAPWVERYADAERWWPLGIGGHVDHLVTHQCGRQLDTRSANYYFDRPYSFVPPWTASRLAQFGHAAAEAPPTWAHAFDLAHTTARFFAGGERQACLRALEERSPPRDPAIGHVTTARLRPTMLERVVELVEAYRTQLKLLGGRDALIHDYESFALEDDAFVEAGLRIDVRL